MDRYTESLERLRDRSSEYVVIAAGPDPSDAGLGQRTVVLVLELNRGVVRSVWYGEGDFSYPFLGWHMALRAQAQNRWEEKHVQGRDEGEYVVRGVEGSDGAEDCARAERLLATIGADWVELPEDDSDDADEWRVLQRADAEEIRRVINEMLADYLRLPWWKRKLGYRY